MSSALEHEDLENVALVRMEDVQPSRNRIGRTVDKRIPPPVEEIFEYSIDDQVEYENDNDSDSNIGSMVSIHSEEMIEEEEEYSDGELIVPEILEKASDVQSEGKPTYSDSWPTLEILPGGVIKNAVECDPTLVMKKSKPPATGEMMYACAKCSQVFKYLFCLVKHVKWHEDQNKTKKNSKKQKKSEKTVPEEYICLHTGLKKVMLPETKKTKRKQPKRLKKK